MAIEFDDFMELLQPCQRDAVQAFIDGTERLDPTHTKPFDMGAYKEVCWRVRGTTDLYVRLCDGYLIRTEENSSRRHPLLGAMIPDWNNYGYISHKEWREATPPKKIRTVVGRQFKRLLRLALSKTARSASAWEKRLIV